MSLPRRAPPIVKVAALVATTAACTPDEPQLVALHGCGLEQEGELSGLRVVVRGDFAPSADTELLLGPNEHGRFAKLPEHAAALTVEGLIGDFVAAVGRTRGVEEGQLAAYFAPPNSLCSVPSGVSFREEGGTAVNAAGELLWVGGRDADGVLLDELVRVDLDDESAEILEATLPAPTAGQTLHFAGERRFMMIGGARAGERWFSTSMIDLALAGDPVQAPVTLEVSGTARGVAYHGAASMPDGRVLVVGGCESIDGAGACSLAGDGDEVAHASFWIDPVDGDVDRGPDLARARFEPTVLVARDGVAYVVGGRDGAGEPVPTLERLPFGAEAWEVLDEELDAVAGAALIEDGLVVVALTDGSLRWFGEAETGSVSFDSALSSAFRRPLVATAGERVLADTWLLPVGSAAGDEALAVDLVAKTPGGAAPPHRVGPRLVPLEDGTVLLAGGFAASGEAAVPFLARARLDLDGPDEQIPDVAGPDGDAFIANPPGTASVEGEDLAMIGSGQIEEFPRIRAHVRGFRSRSFAFDFVVQGGGARAHVLLLQGALEGLSFRLDPDGVVVRRREANGQLSTPECEIGADPRLDGSTSLQLEVSAKAITLKQGSESLAECVGLSGVPAAIGFGVSGPGTSRLRQMRLRRG